MTSRRRRTPAEVWQDALTGLRGLPVTLPLACRSLRRRPGRALLAAVAIAACLAGFVLFSAFIEGRAGAFTARVAPLRLPTDIVIAGEQPFNPAALQAAERRATVTQLEAGWAEDRYTAAGRLSVLWLPSTARLLSELNIVAGRLPVAPNEVLLPEKLPELTGATVGGTWALGPTEAATIVGVYRVGDDWLTQPILLRTSDGPLNRAFVWLSADRNDVATAATIAAALGGRALHRDTPRQDARALLLGVYAPGYGIATALFGFVSLGLLSVLLLSFIQRKRQFGVMKAVGLTNPELQFLLLAEGGMIVAAGAIVGIPTGMVLVSQLSARLGLTLTLRPGALAGAVVLAAAVFYLGSLIPATVSRQAPVDALLYNRRVYYNGNPSCARCGRCGGF